MKTVIKQLSIITLSLSLPLFAHAQEWDDDIYRSAPINRTPSKATKQTTIIPSERNNIIIQTNGDVNIDVDSYNRRYSSPTSDAIDTYDDNAFEYTDRIVKFHNPQNSVTITSDNDINVYVIDDRYKDYYASRDWNFNIGFGWGWGASYYPWYTHRYGYYNPYRYSLYYSWYDPWYYEWSWHYPYYSYYNPWYYSTWYNPPVYYGYRHRYISSARYAPRNGGNSTYYNPYSINNGRSYGGRSSASTRNSNSYGNTRSSGTYSTPSTRSTRSTGSYSTPSTRSTRSTGSYSTPSTRSTRSTGSYSTPSTRNSNSGGGRSYGGRNSR